MPLEPTYWDYEEGSVEFIAHKGQKAIKMDETSIDIFLEDYTFKDGTIEFDVEVRQPGPFPTLYFRALNKNAEHVYLRTGSAGKANAYTTIQYASIIEDVNLWDLQHEYQTGATVLMNEWNHVKLVVSGKQLRVYVNSEEPNLEVPAMEGNIGLGTGFPGQVIFANLVIKPNKTECLSPLPGPDITRHDSRYLRNWEVTTPIELAAGREVTLNDLPKEDLLWESIEAERRGLINLSREYGLSESRRLVWLKTSLYADAPKTLELKLGFSDEVWADWRLQNPNAFPSANYNNALTAFTGKNCQDVLDSANLGVFYYDYFDSILGTYECHKYDGGGKNDWHYVTITKVNGNTLRWTNRANVSWTLTVGTDPFRLDVGQDCPYYNFRHGSVSTQ